MKKIVVIGANGYIARNLVYILSKDYLDYQLLLYGIEAKSTDGYNNYAQVNMVNRDGLGVLDLSCDVVFMFAGKTGSANGFDDYDSFIDINERSLLNLLSEYKKQNSRARIVFPSTRLVYKGKEGPQAEDAEKEFKTIYAINKFACEKYLEQFQRVYGIEYTIFRICVPYGTLIPGASSYGTAEFMLSKATNGENITLYGDGSVRRTLTYIGDLCRTMIEGALTDKCLNDVFNIGGEDYSLKEMAELIASKYGVEVDYVAWPEMALKIESGDTVFDSQKLDNAIGSHTNSRFVDWIMI